MPYNKEIPSTAMYCRTAHKSIDGISDGIEYQKERLLRFAEENDCHNISWYIDDGESGATLDRPAMVRLISDIKAGIVDTIVVTGYDRIARDHSAMNEWLWILQETDVRFVSVREGEMFRRSELTAFI